MSELQHWVLRYHSVCLIHLLILMINIGQTNSLKKREIPEKRKLLEKDLTINEKWILSGAVCGWGDNLKSYFDLVVFLWIPQDIRPERLRHREFQRYGNEVLAGAVNMNNQKHF